MTSSDKFNRRATGRPIGKFQTLHIEGGGHGFVLVDLDVPIPRPDPVWLQQALAQRGVECEYPRCTEPAVTYIELPKVSTPFLCKGHELACTHGISSFRVQTRRTIMDAMLDEILLTGYGKERRWENPPDITARLALPLAPSKKPEPKTLRMAEPKANKPATITTFNRPKLGQN